MLRSSDLGGCQGFRCHTPSLRNSISGNCEIGPFKSVRTSLPSNPACGPLWLDPALQSSPQLVISTYPAPPCLNLSSTSSSCVLRSRLFRYLSTHVRAVSGAHGACTLRGNDWRYRQLHSRQSKRIFVLHLLCRRQGAAHTDTRYRAERGNAVDCNCCTFGFGGRRGLWKSLEARTGKLR